MAPNAGRTRQALVLARKPDGLHTRPGRCARRTCGAIRCAIAPYGADTRASAIASELFPGREILTLDCTPLIRQGGSLHCISMQLPAGVLA